MTIAPMLIGLPFAFFPVPRPQTLFVGDAFPEPTGAAADVVTAPAAKAASNNATTPPAASTIPARFLDLMYVLLWSARLNGSSRAVSSRLDRSAHRPRPARSAFDGTPAQAKLFDISEAGPIETS